MNWQRFTRDDNGPLAAAMEGRKPRSPRRRLPRLQPKLRTTWRALNWKPRRLRWRNQKSACSALETEAKTLSKMLSLETRSLWPPVIDHISVEKGYEKALGAALGDDLDAPVDPSSPMHWSEDCARGGRPCSARRRRDAWRTT